MLSSLLALLFVFGLLGGTLWLLRRWGRVQVQGRHLQVIETLQLGPGKALSIVRAGQKCFLLAGGNEQMSLISELDPAELSAGDRPEPRPPAEWRKDWFPKLRSHPEECA